MKKGMDFLVIVYMQIVKRDGFATVLEFNPLPNPFRYILTPTPTALTGTSPKYDEKNLGWTCEG